MRNKSSIGDQTKRLSSTKQKKMFYASTGLVTIVMIFSAGSYIFNYDMVEEAFVRMGYPTYIIYPLAIAKLFGLLAIWTRKYNFLTELAYAGFFYNFVLAFFAHLMIGDNEQWMAVIVLMALGASYASMKNWRELFD